MALAVTAAQGGGAFQGSDEWMRETLKRHEAKRRAREAARNAAPVAPFDRAEFTQHVQVETLGFKGKDRQVAQRCRCTLCRRF